MMNIGSMSLIFSLMPSSIVSASYTPGDEHIKCRILNTSSQSIHVLAHYPSWRIRVEDDGDVWDSVRFYSKTSFAAPVDKWLLVSPWTLTEFYVFIPSPVRDLSGRELLTLEPLQLDMQSWFKLRPPKHAEGILWPKNVAGPIVVRIDSR